MFVEQTFFSSWSRRSSGSSWWRKWTVPAVIQVLLSWWACHTFLRQAIVWPKTRQSHNVRALSGIRSLACIDPTWEPMEPIFPRICRDSKPSLSDGLVHILARITVIVLEDGQCYPMTLGTISESRQCHSREADLSTRMLPHTCSRVRVRSKSRADHVGVYCRHDFRRY